MPEVAEKKRRGRKKGQTSESKSFIVDPAIKPFKIRIGEESYDVIRGDAPQPETFHVHLSSALEYIARQKTSKNKTFTIAEFLKEYKELKTIISDAVMKVLG
jgi:hypothetical protein